MLSLLSSQLDDYFLRVKMTDLVERGKAMAAGVMSIFILITAVADMICGAIYALIGGIHGSGLWTGFGVWHLFMCVLIIK